MKHAPAAGGANSRLEGDGPMLACGSFDEIRQIEKVFVQQHIGSIGTHPFMKGLRGLLQRQLGDRMVWCWELSEESLIEFGDDQFLEDALKLLASTLQLIPRSSNFPSSLASSDLEAPDNGTLVW